MNCLALRLIVAAAVVGGLHTTSVFASTSDGRVVDSTSTDAATGAGAPRDESAPPTSSGVDDDAVAVELKGRLYVRNTIIRDDVENLLDIDSARMGAVYRNRPLGLRAEVEVELADGGGEIRDAHLRFRLNRRLRFQVGRFKRPISAIALASRWQLPVIERGALSDIRVSNERSVESDDLGLGGRAVGVTAIVRERRLPGRPQLTVGVFRSAIHDQVVGAVGFVNRTPVGWSDGFPEDLIARLELTPIKGIDVGASFALRNQLGVAGDRDSLRRGFLGNIDLVGRQALSELLTVSVWLEGFWGTNPLHLTSDLAADGQFLAGRAILAARVHLTPSVSFELYAAGQYLDASSDLDEDALRQVSAGVNLDVGSHWRLQAGFDRATLDRELEAAVDRRILYIDNTLFLLQLGAVF